MGLPLVMLAVWQRTAGPKLVQAASRVGLVLLSQASAVLLVLLLVNNHFVFYASWQDLLGSPDTTPIITLGGASTHYGGASVQVVSDTPASDGGRLIVENVRGDSSRETAPVLVHLPPGYDSSAKSYPVLELIGGWHGTPKLWLTNLDILAKERIARSLGHLPQVITVMPTLNLRGTARDLECTDVPHGPQAESWLSTDMHRLILSHYRALPAPQSWSVVGYSTGGYCAAKLALHHPHWYGSAVSLAGYFYAVKDHTTGDLWGGSAAYRNENSPQWLIQHRPPPAIDILVFTSRFDVESFGSSINFINTPAPPLRISALVVPHGGHNLKAIGAGLPAVLDWIGMHISDHPSLSSAGT